MYRFILRALLLMGIVATSGWDRPAAAQGAAAEGPIPVVRNQPSCKALGRIMSDKTKEAITVTFHNKTKSLRGVVWLDFNGKPKIFANVAAGKSYTVKTFRNHVWMFTDGPGNCVETYLVRHGQMSFDITTPATGAGGD